MTLDTVSRSCFLINGPTKASVYCVTDNRTTALIITEKSIRFRNEIILLHSKIHESVRSKIYTFLYFLYF